MKIDLIQPPFSAAFEAIIPQLYSGMGLQIKQQQSHATENLNAGFLLSGDDGEPLARATLYHNPALALKSTPCLSLGAFECVPDETVSLQLFDAVFRYVREHFPGHSIVGPMEGSTWQQYRFVTSSAELPPFWLEPYSRPYYPEQWRAAGFEPLMDYVSHLADFDESDRTDFSKIQRSFEDKGLIFRNLNPEDPDGELMRLAVFNRTAFSDAFLFTPVTDAEFMEKNRRLMAALDPELVLLALDGDAICGMIMGYRDRCDPAGQMAVVKTLARLPGERYKGLGDLLCAQILHALLDHGFNKMIHALMRADNASLRNSSRFFGHPYKTYSLFQKTSV